MRQIPIILLSIFLVVSCVPTMTMSITEVPENVEIPKQVKFLSQSCSMTSLFQSVVDLSNNELIVLQYDSGILYRVFRTGIAVNPDRHTLIHGTDAPFSEPEEIEIDEEDEDDSSDNDNEEN